ncbi:MAG TPA: glutamate formimidoyltransferase [Thermotogota bacterium]|nr:glutamate formimidoyltransferase [Thermotogota bacterium]HPJ88709.1 glutamate formimidoyltransferase [Thermotogota bacterium]HPR95942.1 glutamate formimidoyltransferase [Thermotogota bacterium]
MKWVESVPNFSEGRNRETVEKIVGCADEFEKVWIVNWSMDKDHNRSVVTMVGDPDQIVEVLFEMTKTASMLIDLRNHSGEHPRMGATDVIPIIPLKNTDYKECMRYAEILGKRIGEELNIPVYLYEKSATTVERQNLATIRKGQFEGFSEKILKSGWEPDYGPTDAIHPSAGVVAVGVREFLIAYNVNLGTDNLDVASNIAKMVRHRSGGLRFVKAMGVELKEKGIVQVSMNLTNFKRTSIYRAFELVKIEAKRYGVPVVGSEIIGLVPLQSIVDTTEYYLGLDDFDCNRVIEYQLMDILEKA